ncbi:hypothetical protein [Rhodophyticola porphyridii]|uniref:hypothetical protein n=1 Tax=Rhodophyticola porphyridii TaxID=1852017 RepID=UPI0035CEF1F3
MPKRQIIRLVAVGLMTVSGGLFAVQAGLLPGMQADAPPADRTAAARPVAPEATATPAALPAPAALTAPEAPGALALPAAPELALTPPDLSQPGRDLSERMAETPDRAMAAPATPDTSQFGLPCGLSVSAEAAPAAMVALDIMAPCRPGARVVIEHSGLTLTEATDQMGLLTVDIPAFETPAFFTIRLAEEEESALVTVGDLEGYDRVAIAWEDTRDLELHALKFGADYGEPGHIWADNAGTVARAQTGVGGFVTLLGNDAVDAPMMAQVYTFPRDTLTREGSVRISIEAPINSRNCGQDTLARTVHTDPAGPVVVTELTFTLPACDAVGDYLVLQNLLQDLRVASN